MNKLREDQEARMTAVALNDTGVHHHHLKVGSGVLHPMKGAHEREAARRQGMAGRPMGLTTVGVPGERAEVPLMMLMEKAPGVGAIGVLLKKMAAVAALVLSIGTTEAPLMMTTTMVLQEAVSQLKSSF